MEVKSGIGKLNTNNIIEIANKIDHTIPFHCITLTPSRGPNGNKLNVANNALTKLINPIIKAIEPVSKKTKWYKAYVIPATIIFANGPAAAIRPVSKFLVSPLNITAPGAANTKPVKNDNTSDNSKPRGYILNSDQSPNF